MKLIRTGKRILAAGILMALGGSGAAFAQQGQGAQQTAAPQAAGQIAQQGRTSAPKNAQVYFHYPLDGIRVPQRFTVRIGLREMGVAPAGVVKPGTGHHHILIDVDNIDLNQPIPSDYNHIHLGNGQTEVVLNLPPGRHTLQLVMGDHAHIPHVPPVMSKKITVVVR